MPTHLPPDEILADFACGTSSPEIELLIAAHLTRSPEGRERLGEYEVMAGAMFAEEPAEEVSDEAFDAVMSLIDQDPAAERIDAGGLGKSVVSKSDVCPIPKPVMDRIGCAFDQIPWKRRLPGIAIFDIDLGEENKVRLLRARPGASVPQHTHHGTELTLIMHGELEDGGVTYKAGDVAVNTEDDDHQPRATGSETCYCLIVQKGDLHFTGRFSRILNYIGE
ncbi:MAG: ChrR family anti-sigma-E factor [Pseudomonadota bacterium]